MMATIFTNVSSGSKSSPTEGSILTRVSLSMSPTGVSAHGVEEREPADAGDTVERLVHLNKGILWPLSSSKSLTPMGVGSWLPKDVFSMHMLRGEEPLDPTDHGTGC